MPGARNQRYWIRRLRSLQKGCKRGGLQIASLSLEYALLHSKQERAVARVYEIYKTSSKLPTPTCQYVSRLEVTNLGIPLAHTGDRKWQYKMIRGATDSYS